MQDVEIDVAIKEIAHIFFENKGMGNEGIFNKWGAAKGNIPPPDATLLLQAIKEMRNVDSKCLNRLLELDIF